MRSRRPPWHECPRCGRTFQAWRSQDCPTCLPGRREESSALAAELRRRRLERRGVIAEEVPGE